MKYPNMKVLHIVAGELTGGAARGAYWLHLGLKGQGVDSKIFTNSKVTFGDDDVISTLKSKKDKAINIIRCQIENLFLLFYPKRKRIIFSTGLLGVNFTKTKEYKEADIIHLHWINRSFVNIKILRKIDKPIVWTIRDMWPFSGGCHVAIALNCENFKFGCGNCKQLNSNLKFDLSKFILYRKKKYFPKSMKIVGISPWITEEAKQSKLFNKFDVKCIFNNINADDFYPVKKEVARKILGIKTPKKIILVCAQNLKDFYKGFDKFIEALKTLNKDKYFLSFYGDLDKSVIKSLGFEYKSFGFLYDIVSMKLLYSAADVFVAPSLMDAFGKTLAEAMSCNTPVVCFNATGPKDIVDHKINGYKAKPFSSDDLAKGIEWVINHKNHQQLCTEAREKVLKKFDSKIVAEQYINLYKSIIKNEKITNNK